MLRHEPLHGVVAETGPPDADEDEVGAARAALGKPGPQDARGAARERRAALLAPLAVTADVGAATEDEIVRRERRDLGETEAGLHHEQQERVIAAAEAGGRVGRGEQSLDL